MGADRPLKWIANYDNQFKGPMPIRQALAESRNAVAVWLTREIGLDKVISTSREMGIRTPLQPYITTALGASEVRLLELAGAYRAMASSLLAEPHISTHLILIQEGLRGVIRLPAGTAHALDGRDFPIPVMGKTGTTSDFRDALFVGSTYGPQGITVAVRIGFDDNRALGEKETGGRTALPIFREIMLRVYERQLVGPVPSSRARSSTGSTITWCNRTLRCERSAEHDTGPRILSASCLPAARARRRCRNACARNASCPCRGHPEWRSVKAAGQPAGAAPSCQVVRLQGTGNRPVTAGW
jgi:membrane carboxypeptidase/penicillin-binding protein